MSAFSFSQKWAGLNDSLLHYNDITQYETAADFGEKAVVEAKQQFGNLHKNYVTCLNNLAIVYNNSNQYAKAEPLFLEVLTIKKKIYSENHPSYILTLSSLGFLYFSIAEYKKAETYYLSAKDGKKTGGDSNQNYADALENLGLIYYETGQMSKAEIFYSETIEVRKKLLGENHPLYARVLNYLGNTYYSMGKYIKAEPLYIKARDIQKIVLGENDPDFLRTESNLGSLYSVTGQFAKAEPLLIAVRDQYKKLWGEDYPQYKSSLNDLAVLYRNMGRYEKAETLFLETAEINKKLSGEYDPDYAGILNNLAELYSRMGQFIKAEFFYLKAKGIYEKNLLKYELEYAKTLNNLAELFLKTGRYARAELMHLQVVEIRKRRLGENHVYYASSLNNLATVYEAMGQFKKAEMLFLRAIEIQKAGVGENHPNYIGTLTNLGLLYFNTGQYPKAEAFYINAIEIGKRILGEHHPEYALQLNNLALLYRSMGQYKKAESLYIEAAEIRRKTLGENHPDYGNSLSNLATLYRITERLEQAEFLYKKVLEIYKTSLGVDHLSYALVLENLGGVYRQYDQYIKAESLYTEALEIRKKVVGENHPDFASSLNNLAILYSETGQISKADSFLVAAIRIVENTLGENHPEYFSKIYNLSFLYFDAGRFNEAELLRTKFNQLVSENIRKDIAILSAQEKENYLLNNIRLVNSNNSFLYNNRKSLPSFYKSNYNVQLLLKGLSLSDTRNMIQSVSQNTDSVISKAFIDWQAGKKWMAKQYSLPINSRAKNIDSIATNIESLEKILSRSSVKFKSQQSATGVTAEAISMKLKAGEAAIEFVSFQLYSNKWTDSTMYAAYLLRANDSIPVFVPLCEEKQLQQLFVSAGTTSTAMVSNFYRGLDLGNTNNSSFLGTELYKLIWEPLEPYLNGIKRISYSPAGKLFSISFQALSVDSNTVLMDKYELQQYTSTRQVTLRTEEKKNIKPTTITLFGNASFTMDSLQLVKKKSNNSNNSTSIYTPKNRSSESGVWNDLPGTAEEVKKIKQLFDEKKINTKSFIQTTASEENLKALSGNSPQILHIATHGFFLPDPEKKKRKMGFENENAYTLANDPLLRSGLILSGGNYAWSGKTPIEGVEDGIATAYEISQLNLSNTELVVLSACETALGDVKGSEGVFGLQRAFKMAGVKKLIVSLWQVPDKETAELMTAFYTYWMKGKTIEESFAQAQADMRKKYSPFYWAAFVLVE